MQNRWSSDWVISVPHGAACDRLRRALKDGFLDICFEVDLGREVRRESGVGLAKTRVLGVACPFLLLEGLVGDSAAALFFPLHVAIVERGESVQISILSSAAVRSSGISAPIAIPLHRTLARLAQAIESAGAHRLHSTESGLRSRLATEVPANAAVWR